MVARKIAAQERLSNRTLVTCTVDTTLIGTPPTDTTLPVGEAAAAEGST